MKLLEPRPSALDLGDNHQFRWMIAGIAGGFIGFFLLDPIATLICNLQCTILVMNRDLMNWLLIAIFPILLQAWVLRSIVPHAEWWLPLSLIALVCGVVLGYVFGGIAALFTPIALLGIAQYILLRRRMSFSSFWVLIGVFATMGGLILAVITAFFWSALFNTEDQGICFGPAQNCDSSSITIIVAKQRRPNLALQPTAYGARYSSDFGYRLRRLGGG